MVAKRCGSPHPHERTVRGMIVRGIKFIPLTNIPLTKRLLRGSTREFFGQGEGETAPAFGETEGVPQER